jgi:hypothetical protein
MRFCGGFFRSRGRARSWIFEGLRNWLTESALRSSGTLERVRLLLVEGY